MKITCINGSPKGKNSNSYLFLQSIEERIPNTTFSQFNSIAVDLNLLIEELNSSQILIIALPLYIDGIPSHLINIMQSIEHNKNHNFNQTLYIISNCGFYEGTQNKLLLNMFKIWADKCEFKWGYGLGVGAGGMIQTAPIGKGSNKSIGRSFDLLAQDIKRCKTRDNVFVNPNFPRFLYLHFGHLSWNKQAKKNKLSKSKLLEQIKMT